MATMKSAVLLTPGPLQTSRTVKQAMLVDYASRDKVFLDAVDAIRKELLDIAGLDNSWAVILLQGAGTMGIEAVLGTVLRRQDRFFLLNSGKYAERQRAIATRLGVPLVEFKSGEGVEVDLASLKSSLSANAQSRVVGYVHHETSTGMVYPAEAIAEVVRSTLTDPIIVVDAISSFGGIPIDVPRACDVLITSSNKCFHGVPGFSIILARRSVIAASKGNSRALTLDLHQQLAGFDKNGQFLVTPPVHTIMAFRQALREFVSSGGITGRVASYTAKRDVVVREAKRMGFSLFLREGRPSFGYIVVALNMPSHPRWDFKKFYSLLGMHGFVIYPGKASHAETFRFGIIGDTTTDDMVAAMKATQEALRTMGIVNLQDIQASL